MKGEEFVRFFVFAIGLGMILTVYAHSNFATKKELDDLKNDITRTIDSMSSTLDKIDGRVYDIHKALIHKEN